MAQPEATHATGATSDPQATALGRASASLDGPERTSPSPFVFLRGGHPLRWRTGLPPLLLGVVVAFLLMARDGQWRWGVPVGFLAILVAAYGALDLIGSFNDDKPWTQRRPHKQSPHDAVLPPARTTEEVRPLADAYRPMLVTAVALVGTLVLMAHAGNVVWGLGITVGWILTAVAGYYTFAALGLVDERARPLLTRPGFWLIVWCCLLYLPTLGTHSLVDPWETHYGEVSREVLARDDWITIWWAEEGFFLSKPILDFWVQALAMATLGAGWMPDRMIAPARIHGEPTHPEWIVRFPSLSLSVIALYLVYRAVSQVHGRRAGLLSSLVLSTMAYWCMLSHQSITDMPFVAALTAAMCLLILGLTTDDEKTVRAVRVDAFGRVITLSGFHLALGIVLICALPQGLYLLSRNVTLVTQGSFGFEPHWDEYRAGSGHECWLGPGQGDPWERLMRIGKWACEVKVVKSAFQPIVQGLLWLAMTAALLVWNRNERRISRLCFVVAWVFAAVSTMGKGVAGFIVPVAVAGMYVVAARKWRDLLRLELVSGAIVLCIVAAPWYVAMYARMGDEFIQQLFVHHMWKRALDHVHDTNTGDDVSIRYFVWQLGYGLFPWTGLVPVGLVWWARNRWGQARKVLGADEERRRDVAIFLIMWFVLAWGLFTYMKTKFHHYVFPAVPPAALLTGIFLDEVWGKSASSEVPGARSIGRTIGWLAATAFGAMVAVYGFSRLVPGHIFGAFDPVAPEPAQPWMAVPLAMVGLAIVVLAARLRDSGEPNAPVEPEHSTLIAGSALAAAFGISMIARDLASRPAADIKGQERLIQLFTYRYDRLWPKEVSFTPALLGLGLAAVCLSVLLVSFRLRRQAIVALAALGAMFTLWVLDVYMVKVAPHWGQRELFAAYYRDRRSTREPLVAFEMNWKGENFYSGGRLVEFGNGMNQGSTNGERGSDRLRTWLTDIKSKTGAVYFVTEFSRVSRIDEMLRTAYGAPPHGSKWTEAITTESLTNKFVVVRARWQ